MKKSRRWLSFLLLNVVVSAVTTWLVVSLMISRNYFPALDPAPAPAQNPIVNADDGGDDSGETAPNNFSSGDVEIDTVIGPGDLESERVLIRYLGDGELSMDGWQLEDENGNSFTIPGLTMFSGGAVTVYSKIGVNTVVELYWGLDTPVWQAGETATLLDANGSPLATYRIP